MASDLATASPSDGARSVLLMGRPSDRPVELRLTPDEALVLFEWLHRLEDEDWAAAGSVPGRDASTAAAAARRTRRLGTEIRSGS